MINYSKKILNKIKRIPILEKFVIVFILLLLICFFSNLDRFKEGYEERKQIIKKTGGKVYDGYYADIYDKITYNSLKNEYEINQIIKNEYTTESIILDVGCGTGHHVNIFKLKGAKDVIGVDNSKSMIKKAKKNYPNNKYMLCKNINTLEFDRAKFTHITCLYFTIYYIDDKKKFFQNCFYWLKPGGFLIIHMVDPLHFDPVVPNGKPLKMKYDKQDRITRSKAEFKDFDYRSDFILDENINLDNKYLTKKNAIFKETINDKINNKTIINEHHMFFISQNSILNIAKSVGFYLRSINEMIEISYENNFLYTLVKPN